MQVELINRPSSSVAKITLNPGENCTAEGGSMIAMKGSLQIGTTTHKRGQGSVLKAFKRMFSGESFFLNHYHSKVAGGELWLAHALPGDMEVIQLESGNGIIASGGAFVASSSGVNMDMSWQGMKSIFSGESMFWLKMDGQGPLVLSSYGAIYSVDIQGDYTVDTGHVVAFEDSLNFAISKAGTSWFHSFLGGEGLVMNFSGKGKIWCQSHSAHELGKLLGPKLLPREQ